MCLNGQFSKIQSHISIGMDQSLHINLDDALTEAWMGSLLFRRLGSPVA